MDTLVAATPKASSSAPAAKGKAVVAPPVKLKTDRPDALYKVGETVTFSLEAPAGATEAVCIFSEDGWKAGAPQKVALTDGRATLTGTLKKPGFLQLRVTLPGVPGAALVAAGFDPLEIKPSLPVPEDFDAFWSAQKKALAAVPVKSVLTPATSPAKNVEAFDVQIECLGAPVSGYFGRPKTPAAPKSLPAILTVHGAGVNSSSLNTTFWAEREGGMLAMDINAHGIPNGKPAEYYKELAEGRLKDYRAVGNEDREKNYFKGMFLRVIRALDFLTSQPEWDGKTLIVYGSSQGGFQAFAAGGLDPRVSFICAGVPAGCDHTGTVVDRINGWPKMVPMINGVPSKAGLETSRYFDNVNFATRFKGKGAAVTVGYIDVTCPPTGIYAAYNSLGVSKAIHADVLAGHTSTPGGSKFLQEAATAHVRAMKTAP